MRMPSILKTPTAARAEPLGTRSQHDFASTCMTCCATCCSDGCSVALRDSPHDLQLAARLAERPAARVAARVAARLVTSTASRDGGGRDDSATGAAVVSGVERQRETAEQWRTCRQSKRRRNRALQTRHATEPELRSHAEWHKWPHTGARTAWAHSRPGRADCRTNCRAAGGATPGADPAASCRASCRATRSGACWTSGQHGQHGQLRQFQQHGQHARHGVALHGATAPADSHSLVGH